MLQFTAMYPTVLHIRDTIMVLISFHSQWSDIGTNQELVKYGICLPVFPISVFPLMVQYIGKIPYLKQIEANFNVTINSSNDIVLIKHAILVISENVLFRFANSQL